MSGERSGTPDYLAPEVIRGGVRRLQATSTASAAWPYECATGSPPFAEKRTVAEICVAHLEEEPPDPRRRRDLPASLVGPLLTALAKDPAHRPATGKAYARLLRAGAKER